MFRNIVKGFKMSKENAEGQVVQEDIEQPSTIIVPDAANNYTGLLRVGMWVVDQNERPAVVTNLLGRYTEINYVDPVTGFNVENEGVTLPPVHVQSAVLKQARWSQIPEKRRPDQGAAISKGYFN